MRFRRATSASTGAVAKPVSLLKRMLTVASAGALGVLAFAPFGYWPLQLLSLAILFYQMLRVASVKGGALIGWAYGFGASAAGVYWLFIAMHRFGGMPSVLAAIAVALLALFMGSYAALAMALAAWLRQRRSLSVPIMNLLVLPALWALCEWLRGTVLTGFSWLSSGYAHNSSPLAGFAPILGVYGVGWLSAVCAGSALLLMQRRRGLAVAILVLLLAFGASLRQIEWTHAQGQPISVRLLQGNVAQEEKFARSALEATLTQYHAAITQAPADLIATPETALVLFPHQLPPDYLASLERFAKQSHSHLLLGIPLLDSPTQYANSAIGIGADIDITDAAHFDTGHFYRYDKHHLVPFGEFIPLGFRWFVDLMSIPLGDFKRGAVVQAPFQVKDQRVLPNICYEDLFGEEIAQQLAAPSIGGPATMLLNLSNLAWYGESIAIDQHLQISQMRALETGRPMLRATNTGATAVINSHGVVLRALAPNTRGTLATTVQGMAGMTPYILYGNKLILALILLALAGAWFRKKKID